MTATHPVTETSVATPETASATKVMTDLTQGQNEKVEKK